MKGMNTVKRGLMWRSFVVMVAVAVLGAASLSAQAAADWITSPVKVTVYKASTGEEWTTTVQGLYENADGDDSIDGDTLYLALEDVFSATGIAGQAGSTWRVDGSSVVFPSGGSVESVAITEVDGRQYVPALESLAKLGFNRGLANQTHLMVTVW